MCMKSGGSSSALLQVRIEGQEELMCQSSTNAAWRNRAGNFPSLCEIMCFKKVKRTTGRVFSQILLSFIVYCTPFDYNVCIEHQPNVCLYCVRFGKTENMLSDTVSEWSITQH